MESVIASVPAEHGSIYRPMPTPYSVVVSWISIQCYTDRLFGAGRESISCTMPEQSLLAWQTVTYYIEVGNKRKDNFIKKNKGKTMGVGLKKYVIR